jgi:hypothetical protein
VPLSAVQKVRFLNPTVENELRRALEVVAVGHDSLKKTVHLGFNGDGKREVRVGYVVENPIWKTSYRLVKGEEGKWRLQAWANVENTSDDDWNDIKLTLVSSRPISFGSIRRCSFRADRRTGAVCIIATADLRRAITNAAINLRTSGFKAVRSAVGSRVAMKPTPTPQNVPMMTQNGQYVCSSKRTVRQSRRQFGQQGGRWGSTPSATAIRI